MADINKTLDETKTIIDSLSDSEAKAAAEAANLFAKLQGADTSSLKQTADDIKNVADSLNKNGLGKLIDSFGIRGFKNVDDSIVLKELGIEHIIKRSKLGIDDTINKIKEYNSENTSEELTSAINNLKDNTIEKLKRFREIDKILDTPEIRNIFSDGFNKLKPGSNIFTKYIATKLGASRLEQAINNKNNISKDDFDINYKYVKLLEVLSTKSKYQKAVEKSPALQRFVEQFKNNNNPIQQPVSQVTESLKSSVKPAEEAVKTVTDNVKKQVETTSKQVEETVKNTVDYISNTINGFTLVGGIAEELKKQFALIPMGRSYTKGNGFNMFDPEPKQLPAIRPVTELSTIENVIDAEYREIEANDALIRSNEEVNNSNSKVGRSEDEAKRAAELAQRQYEQNLNTIKNKVQEVIGYIKQSIANIIKIIREANSIVNRSLSLMISLFEKLGSTVQRILSLFSNFGDRLKAHTKQGNILKGTYTELKSKIDLLVGAFNKLFNNQFINEGKKLLSSVQTLNMLIGTELTSKTMKWATSLENAFGLSASGLIADLKEITAVMYGLGMSSKNVQIAATNLEAVAMSLSATTGYDFSTVISKIQSGMKGMTQSIDDLGLSVRESQMDAFLKKLKAQGGEYANIGTSFSQLTEQQRIYVRYAAIMDQFTSKSAYSAENYSKSLRTITGGLSILNSQIRGLKSELGSLALQLFSKVVQPIIYIIYLVRKAVAWVAKLLNIDLSLNPLMNGGEENVLPIEDETNALNDLSDAADKAKGSLDDLDHISTLSSSSDKDKNKFDYSSLMNISDDYAKVLEELGKLQDDFIEECRRKLLDMLNEVKSKFTKWVKDVTGRIIDWDKVKENFEKIKENFKQTLENMQRIAKAAFNIIGGLLYSIFDDLDSTNLLAKFTTTIEKFTGLIATILEKIQPYIQNFYDKYLSKYVIKFSDWIDTKLDSINSKLDEWQKHWDSVGDNDPAIIAWFDELGRKIKKAIKFIKEIFIVFKALFGLKFSEKDTFDVTQMSDGMKSTLGIAHDLHYTFLSILDIVKQTATKLFDFNGNGGLDLGDLEIALGVIKEKLDKIREFIEENKEPITNLLVGIVTTIATLTAAKFDILIKLIELIVNNAETIRGILEAVQTIVKIVADHPVLTMTLAIGLSVAGKVASGVLSMVFWQTVLGTGGLSGVLAGASSAIGEALAGIAAAVGSAAVPIIAVVGSIAAVIAIVTGLFIVAYNQSEEFRNKVKDAVKEISEYIDEKFAGIKEIWDEIKEKLKDLGLDLDNIYENKLIKIILDGVLKLGVESIKTALDIICTPLESILNLLNGILGFINNIKNRNIKGLADNLASIGDGIAGLTVPGWSLIKKTGNKFNKNNSNSGGHWFANGGVPDSGSIFFANENGNTELVGNFGGYSGVANQSMIIEAMQNAIVQAIRQAGGFNNAGNTYNNYNIGNWLGDEAGVRKLAKQLNNANARSNNNIANTGFVMG